DLTGKALPTVFVSVNDNQMPSVLEAVSSQVPLFEAFINLVLAEHRISWEMVNGNMVPFESKELHQEVVVPTLRLLSGRHGWEQVEDAYQDALHEIAAGHADDAITDAG